MDFRARARDLNRVLAEKKCAPFEGHIGWDMNKSSLIGQVVSDTRPCCLIAQTGFNAGHSACLLLEAAPHAKLISFTVEHDKGGNAAMASKTGADYVNLHWPSRHTIIFGRSEDTVPAFAQTHAALGRILDVVLVDGGHSFKCAYADLKNLALLARPGAIVLVDDVMLKPEKQWQTGPTKAWRRALEEGWVEQLGGGSQLVWGRFVVK